MTSGDKTLAIAAGSVSYLIRVTPFGHLEHLHFGGRAVAGDAEALSLKRTIAYGGTLPYDQRDEAYCLDVLPQEWSGTGRGDYREAPIGLSSAAGADGSDFRYISHEEIAGDTKISGLPGSYGAAGTLVIHLKDDKLGALLDLYYRRYPDCGVIARHCVLTNSGGAPLKVRKLMSLCLDLKQPGLILMSFHGGWSREMHPEEAPVTHAKSVLESTAGFSSGRCNPGFILRGRQTDEDNGPAWGFNLVYSGSHYSSIAADPYGSTRILMGLSPEGFEWELKPGESLASPEAVLSYSAQGLGGLSANFHDFVNEHLIRGYWKGRERPIIVNSWEACLFNIDQGRLLGLAKKARKIGAELFVMDDGWFRGRVNDHAGLGDWEPDPGKLPEGIAGLSRKIHELGLKFGIWVEPEAVNPDSELYRRHPDWAISEPGRPPVYGRHELLLDLTRPEVRDYLFQRLSAILESGGIDYVKWDMNRQLAGVSGAFAHRYILGLYELMERLFAGRPELLVESCASGGNRFDLGMLGYSQQIWASDDTDPIERALIQEGCSYLYPLSVIGAHVSDSPASATLRHTPLATRFAAAANGLLGYELDLKALDPIDIEEITAEIRFYKEHRRLFQYGRFFRLSAAGETRFEVLGPDAGEAVVTVIRGETGAAPEGEYLRVRGLEDAAVYELDARRAKLRIGDFGRLVAYALPLKLNPEGLIIREAGRRIGLDAGNEHYEATGAAFGSGIGLSSRFLGTGYQKALRLPGDYGSEMYLITKRRASKKGRPDNELKGEKE